MHLHRSNRTERLVDALAEVVARPLPRVTEAETIVVQSKGMERWLAMALASRLGVWGHPSFPFPRAVVGRVLDATLGPLGASGDPFEPDSLTWAIAAALPRFHGRPAFAPIDHYLAGDVGATMRVQLAERLARVFDQYVVHRPEMVLGWEAGPEEDFQAELFEELARTRGRDHLAARVSACIERLADPEVHVEGLPARVSLFGIASLPPLFLDLFAALARRVEVHFFLLAPTREYFADIRSPRERAAARRRLEATSTSAEPVPPEVGHPLLASLGKLGRDMQELVESRVDYVEGADLFEEPGDDSALHVLQSDILHLRRRGGPDGLPPVELRADDRSLAVHCCHGPMREVEVLCDQLLDLFEDPSLMPRDVVVMTPDVEAYAPLVEAVFDRTRIPYRIADRGLLATHTVVDAFFASLEVLSGRRGGGDVLDLLGAEAVRARFGIEAVELETIDGWVRAAEVRWGVDAAHRTAEGAPPSEQNTWRFGIDRLLLGHAAGGRAAETFAGLAPSAAVEGADAELLGRFVDFCETLFSFRDGIRGARPLDAWERVLTSLLEALIGDPERDAVERQLIRTGLGTLVDRAEGAGFDEAVELSTVVRQLGETLERRLPAHGFLSGGVTVCQLVPMRSIPFEVVCILGLSDGSFPRGGARLGFDRVARRPLPGDRVPRDDDRHLFLEALLSARRALYLSYVGRSLHGQRELPPSVVVGELLDEARRSFLLPEGSPFRDVSSRLTLVHPLVPWSPRYFGADPDPRLFGCSRGWAEGARAVVGPRVAAPPFVAGPMPPDDRDTRAVSIEGLAGFLARPVRSYLAERLDLRFPDAQEMLDDRLPDRLEGLSTFRVGDALVRRYMKGADEPEALAALRAEGTLPLGTPGELAFHGVSGTARSIARAADEARARGARRPLAVDFELEGFRVEGVLRDLYDGHRVLHGWGRVEGGAELRAWVSHLVLNVVAGDDDPRRTLLIGRAAGSDGAVETVVFAPVADAARHLLDLLRLREAGLAFPLPFHVEVARAYVAALAPPKGDADRALAIARAKFEPSDHGRSALDEPEIALVYPSFDALSAARDPVSFHEAATRVYGPLFEHREDA